MRCPACGADVADEMRFCGACGTQVRGADESGERRLLTVMFCDMVGSTSLSDDRDPEEFSDLLQAYHAACVEIVERHGGYVADYRSDGLLVYFGYPRASDDDVERAIRAALNVVEAVPVIGMGVRVGIHTGLVVIAELGAGRYRKPDVVLGETPNIASRLQDLAGTNEVVISEHSERFVSGRFTIASKGAPSLKGIARPITVYRVLGEAGAGEVVASAPTPFVDRRSEASFLEERWSSVTNGVGMCVIITGEPGVGKSRLVEAVRGSLGDTDHDAVRWHMAPEHQFSPMQAVIDYVLSSGEFDDVTDADDESRHLIAALVGRPHRELELSARERRQRTIAALIGWLEDKARQRPLLLVVEDVHWADPSTIELLGSLMDVVGRMRVLVLCTARTFPEWEWARPNRITHLALQRLPEDAVTSMVYGLGGDAFGEDLVQEVVERSEGVPLFVEELTRAIRESGLRPSAIPISLQHSLTVRLDRLGDAREIAQVASVIGRDFDEELLLAVSDALPEAVRAALDELIASGLVQPIPGGSRPAYQFKHALVRDTAYESMLRRRRRDLHGRVADALIDRHKRMTAPARPELVAMHMASAERIDAAVEHWTRAAQVASDRHALVEAIEHASAAIEASRSLPPSRTRDDGELLLLFLLRQLITNATGPGDPRMEALHVRGMELTSSRPESAEHFGMLCGLLGYHSARGEHERAFDLGRQAIETADRNGLRSQRMWSRVLQGTTMLRFGDVIGAETLFSEAFDAYRPERDAGFAEMTGMDPGFQAAFQLAICRWLLGDAVDADRWLHLAVGTAERLSHPFTSCQADIAAATMALFEGDASGAREHAERALDLARSQGYAQLEGWALARVGRALSDLGSPAEGAARIEEALSVMHGAGAFIENSWYLSWLAEARLLAGDVRGARATAEESLRWIETTRERFFESGAYRVLGEIALRQGERAEGERFLRRAVDIARRQGAVALAREAEKRLVV